MDAAVQKQKAIGQHSVQADQFADRYEELQADPYRSCFSYSRRRLEACLEPCLPQNGAGLRLLDVGCGTGHHLAQLRERGFQVAGVDGSEETLSHARSLNPAADLRLGDVEQLPFPDASFDFVVCIEVLRYLPMSEHCVCEMGRVLKPGGVCLATAMPLWNLNAYWLVNRAAALLPVRKLVRLKQFFTTKARLRRTFQAAGFDPPEIRGVYYGPTNWIERLAPATLPWALRSWEPLDSKLSRQAWLVNFSNMFLVHGRRGE